MSDEISVDVRAEALVARLSGAGPRMQDALHKAVERLTIEVQSHVKANKLSGQALHVQTGTLRRSINRKLSITETTIVGSVGTNVRYAAVHEYGFRGTQSIRSHVRVMPGGVVQNVRAHSRKVDLPARSFLRSTLAEKEALIITSLRAAVVAAIEA